MATKNINNTKTTHKHKNIKIALWNANSVFGKMGEIEHFIKIHEVDIFAISETKLAPHVDFKIRNFTTHRQDRNRRGGGRHSYQKQPNAYPPSANKQRH